MLHSNVDVEILDSNAGEELSGGAFFHLLHWAYGTQLIRGSTPSRRGRKKDPLLLQLLIESTMQVGDMFFVILVFTQ
jgi:hypothetical protein